jgi:glycosyltransferase involved in cell wall biosynthesis
MSETTDMKGNTQKVSVIIPFLNNRDEVVEISNKIREQGKDIFPEIICVDNGPEEKASFSSEFLEQQIVISERHFLESPYSARNRGVERSMGSVVVFVDANSAPAEQWLENGLKCMDKTQADMVAGYVGFDFEGEPNAAKVVDAITSIHQKKSVRDRQAAFTANLFVKREVFNSVGLFEEGVRSGGDVRWTTKATEAGNSIQYCPDAVVLKKARSYQALFKKRVRTGRGYLYTWMKEESDTVWFYNFLRSLKPPPHGKPAELYLERYNEPVPVNKTTIWAVYYVMRIVEQLSFMAEYLRYNLGSGRNENRHKEVQKNR